MTRGLPQSKARSSSHLCHTHAAAVTEAAAACPRQRQAAYVHKRARARTHTHTHTHTHTGACARADGLHFPASPDRTQAFSPSTPQHGRSGRPDGEDSSRENPVLYPTSPPPTFSPYHLLWPREAWGRGWLETKHSKDPGWQRRRVRGMGCACSLTQPALGTTAQLDRAATCRWAGESNERES